jgi:hypothetical protein
MNVWIYDQGEELKVFASEKPPKHGSMKTMPKASLLSTR